MPAGVCCSLRAGRTCGGPGGTRSMIALVTSEIRVAQIRFGPRGPKGLAPVAPYHSPSPLVFPLNTLPAHQQPATLTFRLLTAATFYQQRSDLHLDPFLRSVYLEASSNFTFDAAHSAFTLQTVDTTRLSTLTAGHFIVTRFVNQFPLTDFSDR